MTRSERRLRERSWLWERHFATTTSLRTKLAESDLDDIDKRRLCALQNRVLLEMAYHERSRAEIPCRSLQGECGTYYLDFVCRLDQWGELGTDRGYVNRNGDGRCMSYWVPQPALKSGLVLAEYRMERLPRLKRQTTAPDEVSRYNLECMRQLSTRIQLELPQKPDRASAIHEHMVGIALGDYGVRYGKSEGGRLFHRVIQMPKEGRKNLLFREPLYEFDVGTCLPTLLLTQFSDPDERRRYRRLLEGDIYTSIREEAGMLMERKGVKKEFAKAVNAKDRSEPWLRQHSIVRWFHHHFPHFTQKVFLRRTDMARHFQGLEASIMVQDLGKWCMEQRAFWISEHDGFMSTLSEGKEIEKRAVQLFEERVRFPVQFNSISVLNIQSN